MTRLTIVWTLTILCAILIYPCALGTGPVVTYDDFLKELGKAGLTVREFADLLAMRPNSVSNNAIRGEVPSHLAVIASLLAEMQLHRVPYRPVFDRLQVPKKKPRGGSLPGKFGGDKQGRLEFEQ